jgi:O-methyltransferase/methyltransferase family protein
VTTLWDLMRGAMVTKAVGAAADLNVAEELADGPRTVEELAQATGADPDTLYRILRALATEGVFAEDEHGVFRNTELSEGLRTDDWRAFGHLFGSVFYDAVGTLDPHTSESTFARRFGKDFWSWLEEAPAERAAFDAAMAGGKDRPAERLAALAWREGEVVVDVGGGNGALLQALVGRRPELRGIVFDLPETVRDEAALGARIEFVAGSFFESVPPGDAYVLSGILHDWNDERAGAILRTIRRAAPRHARLLVVDGVVEHGSDPYGAKWLDLLMLVLGGRERTEAEWRVLLTDAGFRVTRVENGLVEAECR